MAVNLFPPEPSEIYSVPGVVLGVAAANIRKPNRNDVLVVELALGLPRRRRVYFQSLCGSSGTGLQSSFGRNEKHQSISR